MLTKEELPECPVATAVQIIGSKWKLLIIRNLLRRPWRFNELHKSLPGLSQKTRPALSMLFRRWEARSAPSSP